MKLVIFRFFFDCFSNTIL
ncbi:pheST operon leader peptide PheM [Gilliamella apicola]